MGAIFASFGRIWFTSRTPSVELPMVESSAGTTGESSTSLSGQYQPVAVTPETVQSVIATLSRVSSCYRTLTVETFWTGGSWSASVEAWTDGGWTRTSQTLPSGAVRQELSGNGTLYYWYSGSRSYQTASADAYTADLSQHIPTYETVLDLDPASITRAGYETRDELPCVFVETRLEHPDLVERYWVSVDNGLLMAAEMEQDGTLVYRMTSAGIITTPCPADASFTLPDGTILHTIA